MAPLRHRETELLYKDVPVLLSWGKNCKVWCRDKSVPQIVQSDKLFNNTHTHWKIIVFLLNILVFEPLCWGANNWTSKLWELLLLSVICLRFSSLFLLLGRRKFGLEALCLWQATLKVTSVCRTWEIQVCATCHSRAESFQWPPSSSSLWHTCVPYSKAQQLQLLLQQNYPPSPHQSKVLPAACQKLDNSDYMELIPMVLCSLDHQTKRLDGWMD